MKNSEAILVHNQTELLYTLLSDAGVDLSHLKPELPKSKRLSYGEVADGVFQGNKGRDVHIENCKWLLITAVAIAAIIGRLWGVSSGNLPTTFAIGGAIGFVVSFIMERLIAKGKDLETLYRYLFQNLPKVEISDSDNGPITNREVIAHIRASFAKRREERLGKSDEYYELKGKLESVRDRYDGKVESYTSRTEGESEMTEKYRPLIEKALEHARKEKLRFQKAIDVMETKRKQALDTVSVFENETLSAFEEEVAIVEELLDHAALADEGAEVLLQAHEYMKESVFNTAREITRLQEQMDDVGSILQAVSECEADDLDRAGVIADAIIEHRSAQLLSA